ncbi:MAG: hypothetical protein ACI9P8_002049, partial [Bacteroidia bacterium]
WEHCIDQKEDHNNCPEADYYFFHDVVVFISRTKKVDFSRIERIVKLGYEFCSY